MTAQSKSGCRTHQLHLCRGVRPPLPTTVGDITPNNLMVRFQWCWSLGGMQSNSSLPSLRGPLWFGVVAPDSVLSMGEIELNCVLMLNWIVWNRTVFDMETVYLCYSELFEMELFLTLKLYTYPKLNCLNIELLLTLKLCTYANLNCLK